jgi:hypothetical protein
MQHIDFPCTRFCLCTDRRNDLMGSAPPRMFALTPVVAMQRHVDYVRRGYHWYVTGVVPARKAEPLRVKFVDRYHVEEHRNARARRRARGEAAAVLLMYQGDSIRSRQCKSLARPRSRRTVPDAGVRWDTIPGRTCCEPVSTRVEETTTWQRTVSTATETRVCAAPCE